MSLKEKLLSDMKGAMKEKDALRLNTIRGLISEIKNQEISLRNEIGDEDIIPIIATQIKKRKEASAMFDKGGRIDLSEKEKQEAALLEAYLPEQVSEETLRERVNAVVRELGAQSPGDMGKVMKVLVPEFKGRADNALVKNLVLEALKPNPSA